MTSPQDLIPTGKVDTKLLLGKEKKNKFYNKDITLVNIFKNTIKDEEQILEKYFLN